ncbi:hypothetical protein E1212_17185 [Jiangella ureilytica]|uniref:Uncharacterized protein n=1 Tax=Jiangella ureilytica TaxID=2530374 RepID=A0A4R4RK09_9ACTN|nr:hypothetical protein [Jiangella ureilytica]TDC49704.1 hypothetical protein E1212_17185 [Jiangella ureilytica]
MDSAVSPRSTAPVSGQALSAVLPTTVANRVPAVFGARGVRWANPQQRCTARRSPTCDGDHPATPPAIDPFPAHTRGDSRVADTIDLPEPCIAPVVFVGPNATTWFAATGRLAPRGGRPR